MLACGVDDLFVHDVTSDQERFIDVYGDKVLPALVTR